MRVTIVNEFYPPDLPPTATLAASLAGHLEGRGHHVTILTSQGGYTGLSRRERRSRRRGTIDIKRIVIPRIGNKSNLFARLFGYAFFYVLAAWRALRLPTQDVFVCMTSPPFIAWVGVLHRILHPRTRVILWSQDCYPEVAERFGVLRSGGWGDRLLTWLNGRLFACLHHTVVLDHAMHDLLQSRYPQAGRMTVIPNWERLDFYPPDLRPEPWQCTEQSRLQDKFVLLYMGNAGVGHQFATVLAAAHRLQDEPVVFLFVGGGKKKPQLKRAAVDLPNVIVHGYVEKAHISGVMAAASCALITLDDAALGVMSPSKMHGNLAMRLPIVYVGPVGCNVDAAIKQYDCGMSLRHDDVDALTAAIRGLMGNPQRVSQLRANARSAFEQAYTDQVNLALFQDVIES